MLPLYIRSGKITTERTHQVQLADGSTHDRNNGAYLTADAQGMITAPFSTSDLMPGFYSLVAHGTSSSATAVIPFQVQ